MKRWKIMCTFGVLTGLVLYGVFSMPPTIQDVKAKHESRLMQIPGVVSVGIGKNPEGEMAIIVGTDRLRPEIEAQIPKVLDGYPVVVQPVGTIQAH